MSALTTPQPTVNKPPFTRESALRKVRAAGRGVATRPNRSARTVNDMAPVTIDEGLELGCDSVEEAHRTELSLRKKHDGWGRQFDFVDPAAVFVYAFRLSATTVPSWR